MTLRRPAPRGSSPLALGASSLSLRQGALSLDDVPLGRGIRLNAVQVDGLVGRLGVLWTD